MSKAPRNDLEAHATLLATKAHERRLKATQKPYTLHQQHWTWVDTFCAACLLVSLAWSLWESVP